MSRGEARLRPGCCPGRVASKRRSREPYRYGRNELGHELLRGFQRRGYSRSGGSVGWKLFRLTEMTDVQVTDEPFGGHRAHGYSDLAMREVFCI